MAGSKASELFGTHSDRAYQSPMRKNSWNDAVSLAVARLTARSGSSTFTRQQLIDQELPRIIRETGSRGETPEMTLSRELQQMRDKQALAFNRPGEYTLTSEPIPQLAEYSQRSIFQSGHHSPYGDEPERFYRFPPNLLKAAQRAVGQWIIYLRPRRSGGPDYFAVARVEAIIRDPQDQNMFLALIEPGTYLDFGKPVPFKVHGSHVEQGLLLPDGRVNGGRAVQSIRPVSIEDFNRIIELGLASHDELLPREEEIEVANRLREAQLEWDGPVDRASILTERKVRDHQFRKRVLEAYDERCAFTGVKLINGGGRAEVQAAHIWSVQQGGPDTLVNGIALSGTAHWMFDRGLLSLSDTGEIVFSHKINDIESVEQLVRTDRKAILPLNEDERPDPRYLAWHRSWHGIAA